MSTEQQLAAMQNQQQDPLAQVIAEEEINPEL